MEKISNKLMVVTGSIMLLVLGVFHGAFWELFDWGNELPKLSRDNESLVQMMNICTITYLISMGIILFISRSDIADSRVGRLLLLSLSVFFAVRLVLEFIFPDGSLVLAGILLFLVVIFIIPVLRKR